MKTRIKREKEQVFVEQKPPTTLASDSCICHQISENQKIRNKKGKQAKEVVEPAPPKMHVKSPSCPSFQNNCPSQKGPLCIVHYYACGVCRYCGWGSSEEAHAAKKIKYVSALCQKCHAQALQIVKNIKTCRRRRRAANVKVYRGYVTFLSQLRRK